MKPGPHLNNLLIATFESSRKRYSSCYAKSEVTQHVALQLLYLLTVTGELSHGSAHASHSVGEANGSSLAEKQIRQ
jgi:hypothetical protein